MPHLKRTGVLAAVIALAVASPALSHNSSKVFMDEKGLLNERLPGDPLYWDARDPRPWGTYLDESDKRYERYRRTQSR